MKGLVSWRSHTTLVLLDEARGAFHAAKEGHHTSDHTKSSSRFLRPTLSEHGCEEYLP
jgi:hypothetical protein